MGFWRDMDGNMQNTPNETPVQAAVDDAYDQYLSDDSGSEEVIEEVRVRSEVERRIRKANLYQAILAGEMFEGEVSDEAIEVEAEFREFALKRLQIFMGMDAEEELKEKPAQFTREEELALKTLAAKILGKPVPAPQQPAPELPKKVFVAAPKPVAMPSAEPRLRQIADPVTAPIKRRSGRPVASAPEKVAMKPPPTGPRKRRTVQVQGTKLDGTQGVVSVDVSGPVEPPPSVTRAPMPTPEMAYMMEAARAEDQAGKTTILQHFNKSKGE